MRSEDICDDLIRRCPDVQRRAAVIRVFDNCVRDCATLKGLTFDTLKYYLDHEVHGWDKTREDQVRAVDLLKLTAQYQCLQRAETIPRAVADDESPLGDLCRVGVLWETYQALLPHIQQVWRLSA